eukprot:3249977-Karenia_brevis.AAC.1
MTGRVAGVHRVLASGYKVWQKMDAILYENGGYLIPHSSIISKKLRDYTNVLINNMEIRRLQP